MKPKYCIIYLSSAWCITLNTAIHKDWRGQWTINYMARWFKHRTDAKNYANYLNKQSKLLIL